MQTWQPRRLHTWLLHFAFVIAILSHYANGRSMTTTETTYTAYFGESITFVCNAVELTEDDFIWQYVDSTGTTVRIFSEKNLDINTGKYAVTTATYGYPNVASTLTINNVNAVDGSYNYSCICNVYKACSTGAKVSATVQLSALRKLKKLDKI